MEKPCPDAAAFLSEDDQTGFDLGKDGLLCSYAIER